MWKDGRGDMEGGKPLEWNGGKQLRHNCNVLQWQCGEHVWKQVFYTKSALKYLIDTDILSPGPDFVLGHISV